MMILEREVATYREKLPELLRYEGRFVLIRKDELIDTFDSYAGAIKHGYEQFGLTPFLVKQIQASEAVQLITRAVELVHLKSVD